MKLPNMALVFAIIIIPISLVFSTYVGYQVSTVSMQSTFDTRIVTATRDAIEAFELNTFGDATNDLDQSQRRNIQASINTFANSFASNFNVSGYDNSDVLVYVPALLFTMYDGYYIYAPTTENQADDDGYSHNKHVLKPYIYYSARYKNDGVGANKYDVVINYSLDNYITITGTINGNYVAKSGYLIDIDTDDIIEFGTEKVKSKYSKDEEGNPVEIEKVTKYNGVTLDTETLYETLSFYEEDFNVDGYINPSDLTGHTDDLTGIVLPDGTTNSSGEVISSDPHKITLKCKYYYKNNQKYYYADSIVSGNPKEGADKYIGKWYTYDNTGHAIRIDNPEATFKEEIERRVVSKDEQNQYNWNNLLEDNSAQKFYQDAYDFSSWVGKTFNKGIMAKTMITPEGKKLTEIEDMDNPYYIFKNDATNILDAAKGKNEESAFIQHKLSVMQNSITYNLNVAISNYANASGMAEFAMPVISENEWNKVLTNISMISFVQGMPIGFKTYNNYAIVTSTNNQMYVSDESIYYVVNPQNEIDNSGQHHTVNCDKLNNAPSITGYPSTEFDTYTVNYLTEGFINSEASSDSTGKKVYYPEKDHYLSCYRHLSLDCYDCIVSRNIDSIDPDNLPDPIKKARVLATGRIKYHQYKSTQYINEQTQ